MRIFGFLKDISFIKKNIDHKKPANQKSKYYIV